MHDRGGRRAEPVHVVAACVAVLCLSGGAATAGATAPDGTVGPAVPSGSDVGVPAIPDLPDVATDAGDAVIVTPADRTTPLMEGDANAVFAVRIPAGATCPGDSANDDWRVQSFIVPAGTDLGTIQYGATRPAGEHMYALYTVEGRPYAQALLAQNPRPGLPGQILDPPPFDFHQFTPDLLPVGRYEVGVACSYYETVERYWDVELDLVEDTDVQPAQRRWIVVENDGTTPTAVAGETAAPIGSIVAITLATLVAAVIGWRVLAARRRPTPSKEYAR